MNSKTQVNKNEIVDAAISQKRFFAFIIDWVIVAVLINIVITFPRTMMLGTVTTDTYFPHFQGNQSILFGLVALGISYLYMVVFPMLYKETLGKRWMHLKLVKSDNTPATFLTRNMRFLATMIFEPRLYNFSLVFYLLLSMATGITLGSTFEIVSWVVTILSGIYLVITKKGMFHDVIAKTKIVVEE